MWPLLGALLLLAAGPPADFSSMQFEIGTWTCTGTSVNGDAFSATKIVTMSADGAHMLVRAPKGAGMIDVSFDATRNAWVEKATGADGSHSQGSSPGWVGDKLIFIGQTIYTGAPAIDYRITTTKVSDSATTETEELKKTEGGWLEVARAHCDKAP